MTRKAPASVRTTCPYCGTGCGVLAGASRDGDVVIAGDPAHAANSGRLCVKGAALGETFGLEGRLLYPEIHGARASWDQTLDLIAARFSQTIETYGPDSVALYVSGQFLTEDYYIANKLMKGFIGSGNIDTNSRLCMASSVAGHKRAFGSDTVPNTYEDLENADLLILTGSNLAWCHPVLYQRVAAAKAARPDMKIVNIDPRRTATSEIADLQLSLAPGADVALFNGLLRYLAHVGSIDASYVQRHTSGVAEAVAATHVWTEEAVARQTGLSIDEVSRFYDLFARTPKTVTVYSQGVNQSSAGVDKVNAIINCHLLTGRIGKPGAGPFSVTGQPNAMGGREVGGLANQLACHMDLDNPLHRQHVQEFWKAPAVADRPGLKAVDLFHAIGDGRIKAVWIMGTNPVDSLPDADAVRSALADCPFVVVSDVMRATDTTALAHVLLPARAWGEKDGTVTNSERRISRQRAFRTAPGQAMPDWWALAGVAQRMGFADAFNHKEPDEIFSEYAAMSGFKNAGSRDFDISGLAGLDRAAYNALEPVQWPVVKSSEDTSAQKRFFADGRFYTPDQRGRFIATPYRAPDASATTGHPFILNTGRIRDQWHTMTRTGTAPRLSQHIAEPFVEIHPLDAKALGVSAADILNVENQRGGILARALVTNRQRRGSVFAPIHWTDQFASNARVDALVAPVVDPLSGQPELKYSAVKVSLWPAAWFGFAVAIRRPKNIGAGYWALAPIAGGWRIELAGLSAPRNWLAFAHSILAGGDDLDIAEFCDAATGQRSYVASKDGETTGVLILGPGPVEAARDWLCAQFRKADRISLLAGRPGGERRNPGRQICACFNVGVVTIGDAIAAERCQTVEAVGRATQAGTGCGSCIPEIARLILQTGVSTHHAGVSLAS